MGWCVGPKAGLLALVLGAAQVANPAVLRRVIDRVPSLDPAHAQSVAAARAVALVYETLLEYDYLARPYRLRGAVAEDLPDVSEDGRVWTFRIRPGIEFGPDPCFGVTSEGKAKTRELQAADVVYSLKRLADVKTGSGGYWILDGLIEGLDAFREQSRGDPPTDYDRPVAGLETPDSHTLRVTLTRPAPHRLWGLAIPTTAIVPREAVEAYGAAGFSRTETGSGPFRLVHWRRNYRMEFERRPGRDPARDATPSLPDAAGAVPVERIQWLVMDDPSTRWMAFLAGQLDLESDIPRDHWDAVVQADGTLAPRLARQGIRIESQPGLDTFYIGFNLDDPVLGGNRKLRQALNAAFDFETWASLQVGRMEPAAGPVPPGIAGRLETPFAHGHDLDRARQLLAEAGYPEGRDPATGRRLTLELHLGRTDRETRESTELLVSFAERVGVVIEPRYHHWPAFLRTVGRREAQMFRIGWVADYPDAENFLQLFYSRNASPGPNRANYVNPRYDALYEEALRTTDESLRLERYRQLQEIVREDCPWVFLHHRRIALLLHDRIRNHRLHAFPYGMEKHWRIKVRPGSAPGSRR